MGRISPALEGEKRQYRGAAAERREQSMRRGVRCYGLCWTGLGSAARENPHAYGQLIFANCNLESCPQLEPICRIHCKYAVQCNRMSRHATVVVAAASYYILHYLQLINNCPQVGYDILLAAIHKKL